MMQYFNKKLNWVDIFSLTSTITIIGITLSWVEDSELRYLRLIAAFSSCSLFVKVYDWLRLFDSTSFYVLLV